MNERDESRLRDMLVESQRVQRFVAGKTQTEFEGDEVLVYAVLHAIVLIGEAASQVSDEIQQKHPEIKWRDITGMRNWIIHNYRRVSLEISWHTAKVNTSELIAQLDAIFSAE